MTIWGTVFALILVYAAYMLVVSIQPRYVINNEKEHKFRELEDMERFIPGIEGKLKTISITMGLVINAIIVSVLISILPRVSDIQWLWYIGWFAIAAQAYQILSGIFHAKRFMQKDLKNPSMPKVWERIIGIAQYSAIIVFIAFAWRFFV